MISRSYTRLLVGFALWSAPLQADSLSISFDSFSLIGAPGTSVTFAGTIQNSSGSEVFLNGAGGSLPYSELTLDVTPFFNFTPLSIPDGESYDGPLFAIAISAVALPGDYLGTFAIQGGQGSSTYDIVGTSDFQVTVSGTANVPEPASTLYVAVVILVLSGRQFWRVVKCDLAFTSIILNNWKRMCYNIDN